MTGRHAKTAVRIARLGGLAGAHARHSAGGLALIGLVVLVAALSANLVPRAVQSVTTNELRAGITALAPERRDLVSTFSAADLFGAPVDPQFDSRFDPDVAQLYGAVEESLDVLRLEQPSPLRDAMSPAEFVAVGVGQEMVPAEPRDDDPQFLLRSALDPLVEDRVRVVDGRYARPFDEEAYIAAYMNSPTPWLITPPPVEFVMTPATAEAMRWNIGERRQSPDGFEFELVGTAEAFDRDASYWSHVSSVLEPEFFDDGNQQPQVIGTGYVHPLTLQTGGTIQRVSVWVSLAVDAFSSTNIDALTPQLRQFAATPHPLGAATGGSPGVQFTSDAVTVIDAVLGRSAVTTAVLTMIASGPVGVLLAVLVLATAVVLDRRRPVLALLSARGASSTSTRIRLALDLALVAVPTSVAGLLIAHSLVPAPFESRGAVIGFAVTAVLAATPSLLIAALARPTNLREVRGDLGSARARRWVVDVVVVGLAAAAIALVAQRGVTTSADTVGVDPLLVAMPLLVALAASLVVLRCYPVLIVAVHRMLSSRGGAVSLVGASRAARDASGAFASVLALVVAVSVSVFSMGMLATLDAGLAQSARDTVGADVRFVGSGIDGAALGSMSEVAGVEAVAGIDIAGPVVLSIDGVRETATLVIVDDGLRALRDDLPSGWPLSEATLETEPLQVVVSQGLSDEYGGDLAGSEFSVGPADAMSVAAVRQGSGFGIVGDWVMVSSADAERITGTPSSPNVVLADVRVGADLDEVVAGGLGVLASSTRVSTTPETLQQLLDVPTTGALRTALVVAIALVTLLALVTVVLTTVIGAAARRRIHAILRVLGARPSSTLVAWQLIPPAIVASITGVVLGLILPLIALAAVDLRVFTGAGEASSASVSLVGLVAVLAILATGIAVAIVLSGRAEARASLSTTLRTEHA